MARNYVRLPVLIALAVLYLLNFHCWTPGIGGRTDRDANGARPDGNEYEIYLGYPACYLAELWRTDSADRAGSLILSSPFLPNPAGYDTPYRYFSLLSMFLDSGFAMAVVWLTYALGTNVIRDWKTRHTLFVVVAACMIAVAYYFAWDASAHL